MGVLGLVEVAVCTIIMIQGQVGISFCNFSVRFSVYIFRPSVLSLNNLKLQKTRAVKKHVYFYTRKINISVMKSRVKEGMGKSQVPLVDATLILSHFRVRNKKKIKK